ncbi:hypothetical protein [Nesterenkonia muleiensis]|uniref:variant leucine-rich repeat-containing protein n=1 Tax=Nesterenkonia muleiensis TaxID=2282648 RepID=UPI000E73BAA6|nr:hypothetical protein [Nesterenkonia muleiensis]
MTENHDLEALASNPQTDWDVLHWIAENHPQLRPAVAANPGTYQELVDALGALGNPEIDAAIAEREAAGGVSVHPAPEPENPIAGLWDTSSFAPIQPEEHAPALVPDEPGTDGIDTGKLEADERETDELESEELESAGAPPSRHEDEYAGAASAVHEEPGPHPVPGAEPAGPEDRRTLLPADVAPAPALAPAPEQKRRWLPVLALSAVVLGAVGVLIGLLIILLGGDDDEAPTVGPPTDPEPTATPPEEDEETDEEEPEDEQPQVDEEAIVEARAAVTELSENSSCDTEEDAGVVASLLAAAGPQEGFPGEEDSSLLESTFESLQSECSSTHAAGVFESARSGSQAPEDGMGEALTAVGTDWADRSVSLRGAEAMSGFSAQGGNVECEFNDGLTCTVYDTNPEQCDEGATYRMTVDGVDLDCDAHLEPGDRETLAEDDSATDGFLVCTELSDRVTCYNSIELFGFEMSNTGNYSY